MLERSIYTACEIANRRNLSGKQFDIVYISSLKIVITFDSVLPLPGIYSKEITRYVVKGISVQIFIIPSFMKVDNAKQTEMPTIRKEENWILARQYNQ